MRTFSLACSEAGISDCSFKAKAPTELLVLMMFEDHVLAKHDIIIRGRGRNAIRASIKLDEETADFERNPSHLEELSPTENS